MKKNNCPAFWRQGRKILIIMQIKVFLLLLTSINLYAGNVHSQRVNLNLKEASLEKALLTLKAQTGLYLLYSTKQVDPVQRLTVNLKNVSINEALDFCLKGTGLQYVINDRTIVISPAQLFRLVTPLIFAEGYALPPITVTGKITNAQGEPLPGASVKIKGTTRGAVSNADGRFSLQGVPVNAVLVFSYIGYQTQEIPFSGKTVINIVLKENVQNLNNVVVTGIFNKPKESFTGTARVVTAQELQRFQGRNIFLTLSNIDPSFNAISDNNSGSDPNHLPDIQLRGTRNLPNLDQLQTQTAASLNTPLIILDGFETTLQRMMDLDNNEIASITLLKDGSSTALYGSRGANGVIVITTKEPAAGKLKLSYKGGISLSIPDLSSYHLLNAKDKLELERLSGFYESSTKDASANIGLQQYYNQILALVNSGVNTDWLAKPIQTQTDQNHYLKLEGGDQAFRYSMGVQYNDINGVMKGSGRQTTNGTIDLSYRLKNLNFRNSLIIGQTKSKQSPWGSFADYAKLNPYWSPYDDQGKIVQYFSPYNWNYWTQTNNGTKPYPNPMYDATLNTYDISSYTSITDNFQVEWTPVQHLLLRGGAGIIGNMNYEDNFKPAEHSSFAGYSDADLFRKGSYAYTNGKDFNYTVNLSANYSNLFAGVHSLYVGANLDVTQDKTKNYLFNVEGFPDESIDFLGMALQYQQNGSPGGSEATTRRIGVVGNANYAYKNRYLADFAYRLDGASQFGTDRRFAPFWSAGIGWNLHNESFIKDNLTFVDRLKLRASYGVTGNQQFSAYQSLATYTYMGDNRYKTWLGATQTALGNPDLEWQKTGKYNIGLESELFNRVLTLQADVYIEKTANLLSSLELPYSNGFTSYVENIGKLEQHGFELMASVMLVRDDVHRINWSITGNIAYNEDKIVKLSQAMKAANDRLALLTDYSTPNKIIREGASQNTIYAVRSLGIDPSTGKELFLNKDGGVTYTWAAADRVAVGVDQPKYRGNFSTLFRYGNVILNASFSFRFGGQIYNQTLIDKVENADRLFNVDERVFYDRWKQPGDETFFRGINELGKIYPSSRFVQDESTLTCQNVNVSYDLNNKNWLHRMGMQSLTITANTGELFYLSTVRQERGLDYPFTRQISLSLFATF